MTTQLTLPRGTVLKIGDEIRFRSTISMDTKEGRIAGINPGRGAFGEIRVERGQISEWLSVDHQLRVIGENNILIKTGGHECFTHR